MPPVRKKGPNNINFNNNNNNTINNNNYNNNNNQENIVSEFQLGDLVLAKVEGFPPWPAKVSRPEDWVRTPEPNKYFVQFFGTQEIAFVASAGIQAFTSEIKIKLLSRCKGKTVKYFAQAVKEIFEAFEELQKHGDIRGALKHDASHVNINKINGSHVESAEALNSGEFCQNTSVRDRSYLFCDSTIEDKKFGDMKNSIADRHEKIRMKKESDGFSPGHAQGSLTAPSLFSPNVEGKASDENRITSAEEDKKSSSRDKLKGVKVGAKRKIEGEICHADDAKSGGSYRDGTFRKALLGGHAKRLASNLNKFELNTQGKTSKNPFKGSKLSNVARSSPYNLASNAEGHLDDEHPRQKKGQAVNEQSLSVKTTKHVDAMSDTAKGSVLKNGNCDMGTKMLDEEAVPPVAKRHLRALDTVSNDGKRSLGIGSLKNDMPKKRRAVRLCDDDSDDEPKTPVHKGSMKSGVKVSSSVLISDSANKINEKNTSSSRVGQNLNGVNRDEGASQKNYHSSAKPIGDSSVDATLSQRVDNSTKSNASHSPGVDKRVVKECKADLVSPTKSPQVVAVIKTSVEQPRPNRPFNRMTNSTSHSKAKFMSAKDQTFPSGGSNSSLSQVSTQKSRQPIPEEEARIPPKTGVMLIEPATLDNHNYRDLELDRRLEDAREKSGSLVDSKASDKSMKNLIAQAKKLQAHKQTVLSGGEDSVIVSTNVSGKNPSPSSTSPTFHSGEVNVTQLGESHGSFASPLGCAPRSGCKESEEKGLSLGLQSAGSTLSVDTEAAVVRDAFEGMIETLSRTKESIGRATRLAIDCAKHGIANEVVDLLIRKLENESSFHRRVDLFFLVDSITQCSHNQKGIAGASYLPIVQATLPRLLGAAAPPGHNGRENRRQCLKVLRLWLERKILPDSVLRRFMEDIGGSKVETSSGISFKRPSRASRSVDDPIREMEGMLVDEYGSNTTFNLPGFLSTHGFVEDEEDEDDVPSTPHKQSEASPLQRCENASTEPETGRVTPNIKCQHILEDVVDGELEMGDASGSPKDGASPPNGLSKKDEHKIHFDAEVDSSTDNIVEPPSLDGYPPSPLESPPPLDGSPPSPLESPPPLPPLPSSPPPPPPPPLSPSPQPPPPPPSTMVPQPPLPALFSSGPPQADNLQYLVPLQLSVTPTISSMQGGNTVQMAGNTSQQVPCFTPTGTSMSRPLEYGQIDMHPGPQAGLSNQQFQQHHQFQPSPVTSSQRAFPHAPLPQAPLGPYVYNNPPVQQHMPHPHPHHPAFTPVPSHPYPSSNSEGLRRFNDEQRRSAHVEYKADNHHNAWVNGGLAQSCPTTTFSGKAYFRPPERAPTDYLGHHASAPNSSMGGHSTTGHGINQMLPFRPDMSSVNCWRPV